METSNGATSQCFSPEKYHHHFCGGPFRFLTERLSSASAIVNRHLNGQGICFLLLRWIFFIALLCSLATMAFFSPPYIRLPIRGVHPQPPTRINTYPVEATDLQSGRQDGEQITIISIAFLGKSSGIIFVCYFAVPQLRGYKYSIMVLGKQRIRLLFWGYRTNIPVDMSW